jgi:hypothetical protein
MNEPQIISKEIIEFENVYSPTTILGVYANAIHTRADNRIILAKGQYQIDPTQRIYGGYFYDSIKSPDDSKSIKIKITGQLRGKLQNNLIYIFKGYIEKKISFSSIELVLVVDDVHRQEENPFTEEDIKRFELLQKKVSKGFRDLEAVIKEHIYNNTKPKIANIYGTSAIVDKDFEHGIGEAIVRFNISKHRCNITSKAELITCIKKLNLLDFDIIAIVRGGGDKSSLEIFNDSELGNEAINIKPLLVTALGHTVNESLLDKIADKKFALPHDYGSNLKTWVDEAIQEQDKSKSIFIEQVKKDLTKTFDEQIKTLQKQLEIKNKEFETAQLKFKEMVEQNQKDKAEIVKAKEKAFEAEVKSLSEQIKAKEESIKVIQENNLATTKQQVAAAITEFKTKYEIALSEKTKLTEQINQLNNSKSNVIVYVIISIIIGLAIGLMMK